MKHDHFMALADQGIFIEEAFIGEPPEEIKHCFSWWQEMHKERSSGFSSQPLNSVFIAQWLNLYGITPFDIELKAVRIIDEAFLEVMNGRHSKTSNNR